MGLTHSKGPSRTKKVKKYAQKPPGFCCAATSRQDHATTSPTEFGLMLGVHSSGSIQPFLLSGLLESGTQRVDCGTFRDTHASGHQTLDATRKNSSMTIVVPRPNSLDLPCSLKESDPRFQDSETRACDLLQQQSSP